MKSAADRRSIAGERVPGARAQMQRLAQELLQAQLRLARYLTKLEEAKHYRVEACASIAEYAARFGIAKRDARGLADLGSAMSRAPELERAVREGRTDTERAAIVARVLRRPELMRKTDDWTKWAETESPRSLYRRVRERKEEAAQAAPAVVQVSVFVREEVRTDFERARVLASRSEGTTLTPGQTFHRVVTSFLDARDPMRRKPGTRRLPDTAGLPESRGIPAEVVRSVLKRSGDCCEFPGCDHKLHLQFAHIVAHANGGSQEADNLLRLCTLHHALFDSGVIRLIGGTLEDPIFWVKGVGTVCSRRPIRLGDEPTAREEPPGRGGRNGGASLVGERTLVYGAVGPPGRAPPGARRR